MNSAMNSDTVTAAATTTTTLPTSVRPPTLLVLLVGVGDNETMQDTKNSSLLVQPVERGGVLNEAGGYNWSFICIIAFVFAGTLGNALVCLAVSLERSLQNVTNWFLVSLAIADLLVCTVVMPFGMVAIFLGYWPLSAAWCNVYVTCDVLACSASILHMCCISLGRYLGIKSPLRARHSKRYASKRMVLVRVVLVWLLALLISCPISVLGLTDTSNIMIGDQCVINNRGFAFFGSLAAFYVPMIIMVVSYALTVQLLRTKAKMHAKATPAARRLQRWQQQRAPCGPLDGAASEPFAVLAVHDRATQTPVSIAKEAKMLRLKAALTPGQNRARIVTASNTQQQLQKQRQQQPATPSISSAATVANEQKASKVLGVVFFTFVLCWAPFFVLNATMAACPSCSISEPFVAVALWLGYVSSTINPIIYTVFNRTFKRAFVRLLLCRCHNSYGATNSSVRYTMKRNNSRMCTPVAGATAGPNASRSVAGDLGAASGPSRGVASIYDGFALSVSQSTVGIGLVAMSSNETIIHY